jgi:hypothetical protein
MLKRRGNFGWNFLPKFYVKVPQSIESNIIFTSYLTIEAHLKLTNEVP